MGLILLRMFIVVNKPRENNDTLNKEICARYHSVIPEMEIFELCTDGRHATVLYSDWLWWVGLGNGTRYSYLGAAILCV